MLVDVRTIGAPFYAPKYFVELWSGWNTRVEFGGFTAIIRPLADIDRAEDVRDHCGPTWTLIKAVADIRVIGARYGWWTDHWAHNLDGWRGYDLDGQPPPHVVRAVEEAYPLPRTVAEAHDEYAYWAWRAYGISMVMPDEDVTTLDVLAAPELDIVCQVRAEVVRRLLVADLVATSIGDVELRMRMHVFTDGRDYQHEAAVLRDLSRLKQAATLSAPTFGQAPMVIRQPLTMPAVAAVRPVVEQAPTQVPKRPKSSGVQNPEVTAELLRMPRPSDRAIAQKVGVSPTTVGTERKRLIAAGEVDPNAPASVTRRNVLGTYQMRARRGGAQATAHGKSMECSAATDTVTTKEPLPLSSTDGTARELRVAPVSRGDGKRSSRPLKDEQLRFPWER